MCPRIEDGTRYCPIRRYRDDAYDILNGTGSSIGACNLLAAIECGDVSLDMLPVSLEKIEEVAGRALRVIAKPLSVSEAAKVAFVK